MELMEEDTIVMGSDGLFDNIFDREIVSVISSSDNVSDAGMLFLLKCNPFYLKLRLFCILTGMFWKLAKALANLAHAHSKDSSFDSPYSQEARAQVT